MLSRSLSLLTVASEYLSVMNRVKEKYLQTSKITLRNDVSSEEIFYAGSA